MWKCMIQALRVLGSPERCVSLQGLLIAPSLSFLESKRDMPFSFPAPGVITGSGNGSVGHLGLLHAKRREINVNTLKKTAQWRCQEALPLVLGNHQDLDDISGKMRILEARLSILSSSWEDGYRTKDSKHVSKEWVVLSVFLAKYPYGKSNILKKYLCVFIVPSMLLCD